MLVGLYRSNPDAFIRNNMNLVSYRHYETRQLFVRRAPAVVNPLALHALEAPLDLQRRTAAFYCFVFHFCNPANIALILGSV